MDIKNKLLEMLICPECKQNLSVTEYGAICKTCRLLYPFGSGVIGMQADSAVPLEADIDEKVN